MLANLAIYIPLLFIIITSLTIALFYYASGKSKVLLIICSALLLLQSILGLNDFYSNYSAFPPRFVFLLMPSMLVILVSLLLKSGREFIEKLDIKVLTYLHIIRIPVEITLLLLYMNKFVPEIMTFEGRNFDILSGISAPIVAYLYFSKKIINKNILLIWNFLTLGLLINIVVIAILSLPYPIQKFGSDMPNIAVLHFPFNLLPAIVVPIVFYSHIVVISRLLRDKN